MARCQACDASLRWVKTERGRSMPLDVAPNPEGNVRITNGVAVVLTGAVLDAARADGAVLYLPHHASCPNADQFRRRR